MTRGGHVFFVFVALINTKARTRVFEDSSARPLCMFPQDLFRRDSAGFERAVTATWPARASVPPRRAAQARRTARVLSKRILARAPSAIGELPARGARAKAANGDAVPKVASRAQSQAGAEGAQRVQSITPAAHNALDQLRLLPADLQPAARQRSLRAGTVRALSSASL